MSQRYLLTVLFILSAIVSMAQFNDSTNYFISLNSTGIINKTNDRNSWILNNNLKFSLYRKQISLNSSTGFIYGEQQQLLSNRDFNSALDFNYYLENRPTYFWGLASYEKNFSLKIDNRLQAGLGIGYNLVDRANAIITLSDGILYESSDLRQTTETTNVDYETLRNSFRLKFRFIIAERITIDGSDFLQHSLANRADYIIRSQTNFSLKLMKWLSFTTGVTYNKISLTSRENLLINFGLSLERYF
jgi:hypothetical protein